MQNKMKKIIYIFVAICAMTVMIGCKNKGQTAPADANDSVAAVIDSIIEENDTTPLPMFLIGNDGKYMQMLYWTNIEEPKKNDDEDEYYAIYHKSWELQEMFRRNAAQYTNLLQGDKVIKLKYVDEVLKDPDGNTPSIGEIHGRDGIPSLCARFDYVNLKDKRSEEFRVDGWGLVVCTDSYLATRKVLDVKSCQTANYDYPKLPADIVKQLETQYGMKAERSSKTCIIANRYTMGAIEFKGEYKNAPKDKYDADRKFALAIELLVDSGKIYVLEQLGYYDPEYGGTWNADADGYIPNDIAAAFEGPKGLELCYTHGAPESFCVGMLFPREGKLVEMEYECYHSMVDEEIPVWKKDFAEMQKLYLADDPHGHKDIKLTKWTHCYIDYDNEWIWLRDKDDKNGAFFIRKDGKFKLVDVENAHQSPSSCQKDGIQYLKFSGSAGGPAYQHIIYAFKDGKQLWQLFALEVYGELSECSLNGKDISKEEGQAYLDKVPEGKEINAWFKDIDGDEQ
jgi:hypothetical protein